MEASDIRLSKEAFDMLHHILEAEIVDILRVAGVITALNDRLIIQKKHFLAACVSRNKAADIPVL